MTKNSDSKNLFNFELPEGLDNDLGGDWESAFQAEDFMLTPDDEAEIFFEKEKGADDNDFDLAALLDSADSQSKQAASQSRPVPDEADTSQKTPRRSSFVPEFLLPLLGAPVSWFQSRPFSQKILLTGFPVICICLVAAALFFHTTTRELAEKQSSPPSSPAPTQSPHKPETPSVSTEVILPIEQDNVEPTPPGTYRKKWLMNDFFIATQSKNGQESLLIKIDLSLVLLLKPNATLPEEQRTSVRDTIYQFFVNRPPDELRRYSLARGEMVRNLESWLKKEWPQNQIASVMFDRYEILN